MDRIPVAAHAEDPLSQAGVASQLRSRPEILIVEPGSRTQPRVAVVVADSADEPTMHRLCALQLIQRQVPTPRGLTFNGLAGREIDVLRLVAEGYDTAEIVEKLAYSERTVKTVLHDVTSRLGLRNRSHAVAYAVRQGLI